MADNCYMPPSFGAITTNVELLDGIIGGTKHESVQTPNGLVPTVAKRLDEIGVFQPKGPWLTGTNYVLKDVAKEGDLLWTCVEPHLSGTFAVDLAAGKWVSYTDFYKHFYPTIEDATTAANNGLLPAGTALLCTGYREAGDSTPVIAIVDPADDPANPFGGPIRIIADLARGHTGIENLAALPAAVEANFDAGGAEGDVTVLIVGDSRVAGTGLTPGHRLDELLEEEAKARGINALDFGRFGYGGKNSYYMLNTALDDVMSNSAFAKCAALIYFAGTNENVDTGPDSPAQTPAQTEANLRASIAKVRDVGNGGRSPDQMDFIIVGQTPANNVNPAYTQTEGLARDLDAIYREVATDENCIFFDLMDLLFRRAHNIANYMDVSIDGSQVHPGNSMMKAISSYLAPFLMPTGMALKNGYGRWNSKGVASVASPPSVFPFGESYWRAAAGFPVDGRLTVSRAPDNVATQWLVGRATGETFVRSAAGLTATWGDWRPVTHPVMALAVPESGFEIPNTEEMTFFKTGRVVQPNGYVKVSSPAVLAAGTVFTTLPVEFRPLTVQRFTPLYLFTTTSTFEKVDGEVAANGEIKTIEASTGSVSRIYFRPTSWISAAL